MPSAQNARLSVALLAVAALVAGSTGCTYLTHRGEDFLEIADIGVTYSSEPGGAIYAWGVSFLGGGVANVDGYFIGWGGGQIGITRHYIDAWGLLAIGEEHIGWGDFDLNRPETLHNTYQGVLGLPHAFYYSGAGYTPACIHHLHIGWVGVVGNLRYMEMIDFILGWTTLDIGGDDGRKVGRWPWGPKGKWNSGSRRSTFRDRAGY